MEVPIQCLLMTDAILTGIKWYLKDILIHISLMTSEAVHFLVYLLAILYVFFGKMSIEVFCPFSIHIIIIIAINLYYFLIYFVY